MLQIFAVIIVLVTAPVWSPFVFLQTLFENFVKQLINYGWIIDPNTKFILLSVGFILLSTVYCFGIVPILTRIFNFSSFAIKIRTLILRIFRQPITPNQKPPKFLIKKKILVWVWLLSLVCLPFIAFHTQVGFTRSDAEVEQNVFDQLKLIELEKKYALFLSTLISLLNIFEKSDSYGALCYRASAEQLDLRTVFSVRSISKPTNQ